MGLIATVYRNPYPNGDCTNGGWSSYAFRVCVVNADGPFDPDYETIGVKLIKHRTMNHVYAVSVDDDNNCAQVAFGGNFLYTSDSRFSELARRLLGDPYAFVGAIPIHDRKE